MQGTKVDTRADIEEDPPLWLPERELELGEDMLASKVLLKVRKRSVVRRGKIPICSSLIVSRSRTTENSSSSLSLR